MYPRIIENSQKDGTSPMKVSILCFLLLNELQLYVLLQQMAALHAFFQYKRSEIRAN